MADIDDERRLNDAAENVRRFAHQTGGYYNGQYTQIQPVSNEDAGVSTEHTDGTYLRRAFLSYTPSDHRMADSKKTTGYLKWTDTSLGGNYAINTPYQFTSFADLHAKQIAPVGFGMGRFYSEAIDDNRHDIHMRFGVQEFNTFSSFFLRWYDYGSAKMARTGRAPGFFYTMGNIIGLGLGFVIPLSLITAHAIQFFIAADSHSFWNVRPAMHLYWKMVNNLVSSIAANMHLIASPVDDELKGLYERVSKNQPATDGSPFDLGQESISALMPDVWKTSDFGGKQGYVLDVMSVCTRAQRYYSLFQRRMESRLEAMMGKGGMNLKHYAEVSAGFVEEAYAELSRDQVAYKKPVFTNDSTKFGESGLGRYLSAFYHGAEKQGNADSRNNGRGDSLSHVESDEDRSRMISEIDSEMRQGYYTGMEGQKSSQVDSGFLDFLENELYNGAGWITFRVNGKDSVSESFSNSATESSIAQSINSTAKMKQQLAFNMAGGNMLGETIKGAMGAIYDGFFGMMNSFGLGGIAGALFSGSNIDIPKTWSESSFEAPSNGLSYKLQCSTPYNHPVCVLQDLWLPSMCLLAGTAPISHGPVAHGSPLYVELYDKGRCQIRRGLISSLSITRGTGNVPWSPITNWPTAIDISFKVLDLSTILHVPLMTESSIPEKLSLANIANRILIGPDSALDDYLACLAALGVHDQVYKSRYIKRNLMKMMREWQTTFSSANLANWLGNSAIAEFAKNFVPLTSELRR